MEISYRGDTMYVVMIVYSFNGFLYVLNVPTYPAHMVGLTTAFHSAGFCFLIWIFHHSVSNKDSTAADEVVYLFQWLNDENPVKRSPILTQLFEGKKWWRTLEAAFL